MKKTTHIERWPRWPGLMREQQLLIERAHERLDRRCARSKYRWSTESIITYLEMFPPRPYPYSGTLKDHINLLFLLYEGAFPGHEYEDFTALRALLQSMMIIKYHNNDIDPRFPSMWHLNTRWRRCVPKETRS